MPAVIRKTADRLTLALLRLAPFQKLVRYLTYQHKRMLRRKIEARLRASGAYGDTVARGPFKGMVYPDPAHWASCRFEKVVGFYEFELNKRIEALLASDRRYTDVVIIGAAEGYYAVGFARALPDAKVHAFELHPQRVDVMRKLAEVNQVSDRLAIGGFCSPAVLNALSLGERTLVICDVDGYEETIMDPKEIPALAQADIVLELHDFIVPNVSRTIRERFETTHLLEVYSVKGVPFEDFPIFRPLPMTEIQAMTESDRPYIQDWFVMTPK